MKLFLKKSLAVLALSLVFVNPALAQFDTPNDRLADPRFTTYGGAIQLIEKAANWLLYVIIALAVVLIIYAGFLYLTSGGDEKKTAEAKNYIVYAVIGIAIALLARGIVLLVKNFVA
jgi:hypothetical protein